MNRRSRLIRVAKWGGTLSCAALFILWSFDLAHWQDWRDAYRKWGLSQRIAVGMSEQEVQHHLGRPRDYDGGTGGYSITYDSGEIVYFDYELGVTGVGIATQVFPPVTDAPIYLVIGSCGIAAVLLWRLDRPLPPGHCACGYNLTGNVSGRCPECGVEASQ